MRKILTIFFFVFAIALRAEFAEMRGAWIHSPYGLENIGWDATIKLLKDNGFNAVFANFTWAGVAEYPSEILPIHPKQIAPDGSKIDRLKECLDACKKYGIECHAWVVCWNMGHRTTASYKQAMQKAGRTQRGLNGEDSDYLAPHLEENRIQMMNAITEIAEKYPDVAGIHLDYIRYPGAHFDYSDSARNAFENFLGHDIGNWPSDCTEGDPYFPDFLRWRSDTITSFVRMAYHKIKSINPDMKLSAAVYSDWDISPTNIAQNPIDWLQGEKCLDFLCSMNYFNNVPEFVDSLEKQLSYTDGKIPLYVGIGTYLCANANDVNQQIDISRALGADGTICFQLNRRFADEIIAKIGKHWPSVPVDALLPHDCQKLDCTFADNGTALLHACDYGTGRSIAVKINLPTDMAMNSGHLRLLKNGIPLPDEQTMKIRKKIGSWDVCITPDSPGYYRLEMQGKDMNGKAILARSHAVQSLSLSDMKQKMQKNMPPRFTDGKRIHVGVWQDGAYGATSILAAANSLPQAEALALNNLRPESLRACQVVIIPQPKNHISLFRSAQTLKNLRTFVENGGMLIVTHTLVGTRGFENPFPEIVKHVIVPPVSPAIWKFVGKDVEYHSDFPDCIVMEAASNSKILATANNKPVVVWDTFGQGTYCAIGLGLGIGIGDKDIIFTQEDTKLLKAIILSVFPKN